MRATASWPPDFWRVAVPTATTLPGMASRSVKPPLAERLLAQRERHHRRPKPVRALIVLAGFTVVGIGIAMIALPGPAFVVIPAGLAMLSMEFAWAERLLHKAIARSDQARLRAQQSSRTERVLTAIAVFLGLMAIGAWGYWGDIPVAPV
jgi:uncharacterized protein (TIGR02611 family)